MNTNTERRRFNRVSFHATTQLLHHDQAWDCMLLDISFKGLLVNAPQQSAVAAESATEACIQLANGDVIRMQVSLARRNGEQLGFECVSVDIDSMSHLRRLIELNLGDPEAAQRELSHLTAVDDPGHAEV